jgi:hypothetical protein
MKTKNPSETAILTLAAIRPSKGGGAAEYLFNERQRIFTLREGGQSSEDSSKLLNHALESKLPVKALFHGRREFISKVTVPSPQETAEFQRGRILLDQPERSVRFEVNDIDPTTFNVVGHYLKFPIFRRCTEIIPNYTKAKSIFDYCAQQACNLPGPYGISPCIPFQYVRDGCYARAHKMRWIITTKYGFCCEKVFSFANQNSDTLAVEAEKWGGCCVTWWYHVAPLVRVRARFGKFTMAHAMVIDPGMFNQPVLLSTWLAAQANSACSANAHVSMYSIQPGTAYGPANYAGTAFTTDPSYTATDATLISYQNLTTCP